MTEVVFWAWAVVMVFGAGFMAGRFYELDKEFRRLMRERDEILKR